MFADAIIKEDNNMTSLSTIKKDIEKQDGKVEVLTQTLQSEINIITEKIDNLTEQVNQLYKVLVNHASIINNIKKAITIGD